MLVSHPPSRFPDFLLRGLFVVCVQALCTLLGSGGARSVEKAVLDFVATRVREMQVRAVCCSAVQVSTVRYGKGRCGMAKGGMIDDGSLLGYGYSTIWW